MLDPADFQMPQPRRDVKHPRQGEPLYHQLPPVTAQVEVGPGLMKTITLAGARSYMGQEDNGGTNCKAA